VWEGEGDLIEGSTGCKHRWGDEIPGDSRGGSGTPTDKNNRGEGYGRDAEKGAFCLDCEAWRGSLGLEPTPELFVKHIVQVFREVRRVLKPSGVCFVNLGDSYAHGQPGAGSVFDNGRTDGRKSYDADKARGREKLSTLVSGLKPKDLCGIPWRVAFALQADGWWLRSDIIWSKPNPMPESVTDRPTKSHEYIFLLTKSQKYFWNQEAVREGGKNNDVVTWTERKGKGEPMRRGMRDASFGADPHLGTNPNGRNIRSVWTFATEPMGDWVETSHLAHVPLDAVSGGMKYIMSPYCPVHADQFVRFATEFYGGFGYDKLNRIIRIYADLVQKLISDDGPIQPIPLMENVERSLDLLLLEYFPSAIDRNSEIRKMGLSLLTNFSCSSFAEMLSRTSDRRVLLWLTVLYENTYGNKISLDGMDARLLDQIPHRTVRKSSLPIPPDCLCQFYQIKTDKSSHFACFPQELVKRCILSGTSEKGCCPKCGKPWEPVVEKGNLIRSKRNPYDADRDERDIPEKGWSREGGYGPGAHYETSLTGWRPTCSCGEEKTVPAVVLDPFFGSGTTGIVAENLYRKWIGIELNPEYIKIANKRLVVKANINQDNWLKAIAVDNGTAEGGKE
jgi:DNA modification methylase